MKKLCLLICACALIVLALAGCNNQPADTHTHTYADVWSYDEDGHWYAATCEHTQEKANTGTHVDEQNDGVCDICDYGSDHTHTFAQEWESDADNHWYASTCGHDVQSELAAHIDADNDDLCDVCAYSGGCVHTASTDAWLSDAQGHWYGTACGHNVKMEAAAHEDAKNDGVCDVCAWFDPEHTHTYKTEYSYNENGHWFETDCGHTLTNGAAMHTDANNDGACDVCPWSDGCEHAYSGKWSVDPTHHWHGVVCTHSIAPTDKAEHIDENEDGTCDVCAYLDHAHTYDDTKWIFDNSGHWHGASCGCSLKADETAHTDADNDGACDICDWNDGCEHALSEQWSNDGTHHWHDVTCTHTVAPEKSLHKDTNGDGVCNICGYYDQTHTHTFANGLTVDANSHYYSATCGHTGVRKDEQAHVDENYDNKCDICGGYASFEFVLGQATSMESASKVNGGSIVNTTIYSFMDEPSVENITFEFGNGYLHTFDGLYDRWLTLCADGTVFGVRMIDGEYEPESATLDNMDGYYFYGNFIYYNVEAYGTENLLYNLYAFALENANGGVNEHYNAATGTYSFDFVYYNDFESLYCLTVEFVLNGDLVITDMHINSKVYASYEVHGDMYYVADGAQTEFEYDLVFEQTVGERSAVNEYGPEKFLFKSFDFADESGKIYGDVIYLNPGDSVQLYFANVNPSTAYSKLDNMDISINANGSQIYQYLAWDGTHIYVQGIAAGTYIMEVKCTNLTKVVTIVVGTPELIGLTPQIYYKDNAELFTYTVGNTYTLYVGQTMYFAAMANPLAADAAFSATVSGGTLGSDTITYGASDIVVSTFTANAVGTYTITLTSEENGDISTTLTVNVVKAPDVGQILNGIYFVDIYDYNVSSTSSTALQIIFAPASAGATNGQVTVIRNGSETEVLTYEYRSGEIVLGHVSGEEMKYTLSLNDQYGVSIGWSYDSADRSAILLAYNFTNRVFAEVWVSTEEKVNNDMYLYSFYFGDQGYVFNAANNTYPDMLSSVDNATGAITVTFLDSVAGTELASIQSMTFDPENNTILLVLPDRTVTLRPDTSW